ncbi:MAG: hypothetical protein K2X43_02480 [Hyphomonadaceae bacterium]|jgi:hypothetical protein|nr:hypothetical protein [Hyphomonadaceae bacterium]
MSASLQSHRDRFKPQEWQRLMKVSALYAQRFRERVLNNHDRSARTGEEILGITLTRMQKGCDGYAFKDGDILFFYYLCRCCRRTVLTLPRHDASSAADDRQPMEADDTPAVLTEQAALAFLQRRGRLEPFLSFVKEQKLKGKLRAYGTGFPRYGAQHCEVAQIAKELRVTPATVDKYRSRLRELLEEFELERTRSHPA